MEYWIIVDNRHAGPYSAGQLLDAGLTADTLVWHEGLSDWTRAGEIAELAEGLERQRIADAQAEAESEAETVDDVATAEAYGEPVGRVGDISDADLSGTRESRHDYAPQDCGARACQPPCEELCPPAYIAWSVIVTVLCCTVIGIPAIIFSSMTKSAYYRGDIAKAKRYSELAQWFIIASIVLGVVGIPFQMAFMGLF